MRQRKTVDPCENCRLHRDRCICLLIPRLKLATRLTLIVHAKELKRTTNTGRLAVLALENSQMCVRGEERVRLDLTPHLDPLYETYLLYPADDAIELDRLTPTRPVHLLVPDGNWRQASKVSIRHRELAHIPRVKISEASIRARAGRADLRREHFAEGMATLEAIAMAFAVLEDEDTGHRLMALYQAKLEATLSGRGIG